MKTLLSLLLRLTLVFIGVCQLSLEAAAQVTSVPDFVQKKNDWPRLAQEQKRFQLDGRFESRAGEAFRLSNVEMIFRLPSTLKLPDRVEKGQRVEVSGHLAPEGTRTAFIVSRLLVRGTDLEALIDRSEEVGEKDPQRLLSLAAEYVPDAEFYRDDNLKLQITEIRTRAVGLLLRKSLSNPAELTSLLAQAESLKVNERVQQEIRFALVYLEAKSPTPDFDTALSILKTLPNWDRAIPPPGKVVVDAFPANAMNTYLRAGDNDRSGFHRLAYARLRTRQLQSSLKPDGSNGVELAKQIQFEFPDEKTVVQQLVSKEVEWHLSRSDQLSRQDLMAAVKLLFELDRKSESADLIQRWLKAQEKRFGTSTLAGILRTADEYLFVAEQWNNQDSRTNGIELLKKAWAQAEQESPDDVVVIAERLKALGWERLKGTWMTTRDIEMLPQDDVQLAIREGRVVRGMTGVQVQQAFGKPRQVSRISSSRFMRELWVYEEAGLVIRLQRSLARADEALIVDDVSRTK